MERTKIEQLFENYSFWRHLSEEEKKMLQEQIRWCTYEEGQMVTDTGRDCLGIFCCYSLQKNLIAWFIHMIAHQIDLFFSLF